jgi:hypothetical protein
MSLRPEMRRSVAVNQACSDASSGLASGGLASARFWFCRSPAPAPAPACRRRKGDHPRAHGGAEHRSAAAAVPRPDRPSRPASSVPARPRHGRRSRSGDTAANDRRTWRPEWATRMGDQNVGEQAGGRASAADRQRRYRRLGDRLAGAAGEFRPHVADHAERRRPVVQHLGDVFAEFAELAAAARAGASCRMHHHRARQMRRQRPVRWFQDVGIGRLRGARSCRLGGLLLFRFFERQLELRDRGIELFRGTAELQAPQFGQLRLQPRDLMLLDTLGRAKIIPTRSSPVACW